MATSARSAEGETAHENPELQPPAEAEPGDTPEAKPAHYSAEFLVETEEGFHVMIRGEALTPADVGPWLKRFSKALQAQGFKPVRRDSVVDVDVAAAAAPAGSSPGGEAVKIPGENGKPPRCSLHGPMVWKEGTIQRGERAGQHYEFWACTNRNCRPREAAA